MLKLTPSLRPNGLVQFDLVDSVPLQDLSHVTPPKLGDIDEFGLPHTKASLVMLELEQALAKPAARSQSLFPVRPMDSDMSHLHLEFDRYVVGSDGLHDVPIFTPDGGVLRAHTQSDAQWLVGELNRLLDRVDSLEREIGVWVDEVLGD